MHARVVSQRALLMLFVAFGSTSLGATKVRAATISIPGFADQEKGNKTRGLPGPQLLF